MIPKNACQTTESSYRPSELKEIRKNIIKMVHKAGVSHVGAALSVVDILYVLYYKICNINITSPDRDVVILSKGHASAALYAVLYQKGFLTKEQLDDYAQDNGSLPCHIDKEKSPYFEISSGSLGHGLPVGLGMALAKRMDQRQGRVFVICGDGELNEGSVWEAIMFAGTQKLSNLVLIVDQNQWQGFGANEQIIDQRNLPQQLAAFGWDVKEIDGNNLPQIQQTLAVNSPKPLAVVAHTIKGKGVSFMENKLEWHYKSPTDEQLQVALAEIEGDPR